MFGSNAIQEFGVVGRSLYSQILPVFIVAVSFTLLDDVAHDVLFADDLVFDYPENRHLQTQFFWDNAGNHHSWSVHQKHQRVVEDFEPSQTSGGADLGCGFGGSSFVFKVRNASDLVDDGRLADIGCSAGHEPQSYLFILMPIIFFEISQHFPHVIMIFRADSKALDSIVIVILDNSISFDFVTEIVLVKNYNLLLLVLLYYLVELGVATAIGDPCISDLQEDVHLVAVLLDQPQRLLHVPWEPVYVVFQVSDDLH